ncbi:(deoxy)nucleoside triphosphate pyrophosphohydrolase [Porphyrobacter sp. AAP82]|uniref:(deoxy)nucleoside triphosphate pyrophosphohydrolase n=1 Tax=Porphyrobacter sp. AAP82 TaxID=1248917 RepID=UPI000318831F|nr:(deoxy)nucleoside triphosphate pyrophosphohydrolase [Porphyrobacter sp. AAP82]
MTMAWIAVVAGALQRGDGLWLMHRRPEGKHHAGLWEFPGGKVEPAEMPADALVRELGEELAIACKVNDLAPCGFAETAGEAGSGALVLLLYRLTGWQGEPQAIEGGAVGWFTPEQIAVLPKPPVDTALAARLFQFR